MKIFEVIIAAHRVIRLSGVNMMSECFLPPYILRYYHAKIVLSV